MGWNDVGIRFTPITDRTRLRHAHIAVYVDSMVFTLSIWSSSNGGMFTCDCGELEGPKQHADNLNDCIKKGVAFIEAEVDFRRKLDNKGKLAAPLPDKQRGLV